MKFKKYILVLLLTLIVGCNIVQAKEYSNTTEQEKILFLANENDEFAPDLNSSISCEGIFGDKNDPESLSHLLNEILMYPKIIVPIIIIGLGSLDLGKAVVAGKEDEMKKAQKTFVRRLIAGIVVFLIPVILNIVMYLADIVWNGVYTSCSL